LRQIKNFETNTLIVNQRKNRLLFYVNKGNFPFPIRNLDRKVLRLYFIKWLHLALFHIQQLAHLP
jgi:hypothetical protein